MPLSALTPPPEWEVIQAAREVGESHKALMESLPGQSERRAVARHIEAHDKLRAALARYDEVANG